MKILIAGLGSIGQRHARNLRTLCGPRVELLAFRERGLSHVITDAMAVDTSRSVETALGIRSFVSLGEALNERPDAVFVCNPTSRHMAVATAAVAAGCHVFLEKPVSDSDAGLDALIYAAAQRGIVVAVGYQLRAHPLMVRARALLEASTLGRVISMRAEMGEYLPAAHPYENYRISYAARRDLGGGVLLCFAHEFDYLQWWLGNPRTVFAAGGNSGQLDVDVEDIALTTVIFERDGIRVPAQVHHSFVQRPPVRGAQVVGENGRMDIDLVKSSIRVVDAHGRTVCDDVMPCERNDLFLYELRAFLDAVSGRGAPLVSLAEGAVSLRVALAARRSLASGQAEVLA